MLRVLKRAALKTGLLRSKHFREIASSVTDKHGLEIGGPSAIFSKGGLIPVYPLIQTLDTSNYSEQNIWSKDRVNYVHEATDLSSIADLKYDFLMASHVLEHVANPVKALIEWRRVLKPGGSLLVLLPWRKYTFDRRRPYTSLEHILDDFDRDTQEDDLTHLEEILALHDLARDKPAGTPEQFKDRSLHNFANRCLHHHVFDPALIHDIFSATGFELTHLSTEVPCDIVAFGHKSSESLTTRYLPENPIDCS
jgi:SAM-dependent methyltransferase